MKLGLNRYRPDPRDIKVGQVYAPPEPVPDGPFGVRGLDWGMLGNDEYGDCYWAAAAHETKAMAHLANREPVITTENVLKTYADYLGVYEVTPENDEGTYPTEGASLRRKMGIITAAERQWRTHIGAFGFLLKPDLPLITRAIADFGAVTFCFDLPYSAFGADVWDYTPSAYDAGGHAVAGVARAESGNLVIVSWGEEHEVTPAFIEHYLQCVVVYFSSSVLSQGVNIEGLDRTALLNRLTEITS